MLGEESSPTDKSTQASSFSLQGLFLRSSYELASLLRMIGVLIPKGGNRDWVAYQMHESWFRNGTEMGTWLSSIAGVSGGTWQIYSRATHSEREGKLQLGESGGHVIWETRSRRPPPLSSSDVYLMTYKTVKNIVDRDPFHYQVLNRVYLSLFEMVLHVCANSWQYC
jgi:hypothetical protein